MGLLSEGSYLPSGGNPKIVGANPAKPIVSTSDSPKVDGHITEKIVEAELLRRGYTVLTPSGDNERYDLVVEDDNSFSRIQVKTASVKDGKVIFPTKSTNYMKGSWENNNYEGDIDWFIAYCPERDEFYELSIDDAPNSQMSLRFEEPKKPSSNINWLSEYLMNERFK